MHPGALHTICTLQCNAIKMALTTEEYFPLKAKEEEHPLRKWLSLSKYVLTISAKVS